MRDVKNMLDPDGSLEKWVQERYGDAAVLAIRADFGRSCAECRNEGQVGTSYHALPEPPGNWLDAARLRMRDPAVRRAMDSRAGAYTRAYENGRVVDEAREAHEGAQRARGEA